ncbi:hypothetical protein RvY_17019 [Ramazzottius varieornatus]|uniref:Uncharacterized protein n=1 Tax=Ramazzottius varieornatus TaxID=947166 RepID=A0A1D1W6T1_RAMVA|nr:hypothetical protein RvY_17019 [Ramazzottius varieornatus]
MVQSFGKAGQHNFTTFPGANIQLIVMAYYAYYEGVALNIGKEEYVPLLQDERIGTFEFAHRAAYQKKASLVTQKHEGRPLTALTVKFRGF